MFWFRDAAVVANTAFAMLLGVHGSTRSAVKSEDLTSLYVSAALHNSLSKHAAISWVLSLNIAEVQGCTAKLAVFAQPAPYRFGGHIESLDLNRSEARADVFARGLASADEGRAASGGRSDIAR